MDGKEKRNNDDKEAVNFFFGLVRQTLVAPSLVALARAASMSSAWPMSACNPCIGKFRTGCAAVSSSFSFFFFRFLRTNHVRDDIVALLLQPDQDDGRVQAAAVRQHHLLVALGLLARRLGHASRSLAPYECCFGGVP